MRAIILAAGEGKRLRPYTNDKPKCMVEIDGNSLIDRQINILNANGIDDIIILGGYKSDMLKGKAKKILVNPSFSNDYICTNPVPHQGKHIKILLQICY